VPAAGGDVVQVDVAVIERPAGDPYLNDGLWVLADEQAVGLDRKPALEDNGFRVGQVGGLPPADLQALLRSERSCADPRRHQVPCGGIVPVALGTVRDRCRFRLHRDGREIPVELSGAQCVLEVVPTLGEDGRTSLRFTPVVKHGEPRIQPRPVKDPSGEHRWDVQARQPAEVYDGLGWEVTVGADGFVLVGTRLEQEGTLGHCFFLAAGGGARAQRLLVVRTGRPPGVDEHAESALRLAPPVALQAGRSSARGTIP
jgi:hypothetical protein